MHGVWAQPGVLPPSPGVLVWFGLSCFYPVSLVENSQERKNKTKNTAQGKCKNVCPAREAMSVCAHTPARWSRVLGDV